MSLLPAAPVRGGIGHLPLVWLSAAFVAGLAGGAVVTLPSPVAFVALAFLLGAYLLRGRRLGPVLLLGGGLLLGLSRAPHPHLPSPDDVRYYTGRQVQLDAQVVAEPDVRDTGANYRLGAIHLHRGNKTIAIAGKVLLHTSRSEALDFGDVVQVQGRLIQPRNTPNFPAREVLARQGIDSRMRFPKLSVISRSNPGGVLGLVTRLRVFMQDNINRWLPEPEAALLIAIALGAKSSTLGSLAPILVSTGLIHIIAISGIKVAMIAGMINTVVRSLRSRLTTLLASLSALALYILLTGMTPSGVRSGIMWSLVFVATYLGRGTTALVSLGAAIATMLGTDPSLLTDTGFQMSAVGTLAIVAYTPPILHAPGFRRLPLLLTELVAVTLAAQVGTFPIVVAGFHVVSWSGLLTNVIVLSLLPATIIFGFALGLIGTFSGLAFPLAALSFGLAHLVIVLAEFVSRIMRPVTLSTLPLPFVLGYYALLSLLALKMSRVIRHSHAGRKHKVKTDLLVGVGVALLVTTVALPSTQARANDALRWLGDGQALLLETPHHVVLIDGSGSPATLSQTLGAALSPFTRRLDLVIVTDPSAASVSSLDSLLAHYTLGEVLDVGLEYPSSTYARWREHLRETGVPVYQLRTATDVRMDDVEIRAVAPDALSPNPHDSAGMLRITRGGYKLLVAGASSAREQEEAVFRPVSLRGDTLLLTGTKGYSSDFLHAVSASATYSTFPVPRASLLRNGHSVIIPLSTPTAGAGAP